TGQRRVLSGVECWSSDEAVPPRDPRRDHPSHHDKRTLTFQKPALRKHRSVFLSPLRWHNQKKRIWDEEESIRGRVVQSVARIGKLPSLRPDHAAAAPGTLRESVTCGRQGIMDGGAAGQRSNSLQKRADLPMAVCLIYVGLSSPKVEPTVPHGTVQPLSKSGGATYGKMSPAYEIFDTVLENSPHRVQFCRL
ncbi:hypothetical protein IscW_ISCW020068, partial [Ixodes scapularis]